MKQFTVANHLQEKTREPHFREFAKVEQQKYDIVKKIVGWRIKKGLSQAGLAQAVGVTQQHISKIENGTFSSIATLEKVLLSIGMTVRIKAVDLKSGEKRKVTHALASA